MRVQSGWKTCNFPWFLFLFFIFLRAEVEVSYILILALLLTDFSILNKLIC